MRRLSCRACLQFLGCNTPLDCRRHGAQRRRASAFQRRPIGRRPERASFCPSPGNRLAGLPSLVRLHVRRCHGQRFKHKAAAKAAAAVPKPRAGRVSLVSQEQKLLLSKVAAWRGPAGAAPASSAPSPALSSLPLGSRRSASHPNRACWHGDIMGGFSAFAHPVAVATCPVPAPVHAVALVSGREHPELPSRTSPCACAHARPSPPQLRALAAAPLAAWP